MMNAMNRSQAYALVILGLLAALVAATAALVMGHGRQATAGEHALQARGDEVYHWRLVTSWPKNLPGLGTGPVKLADWVREASNGRLQIEVYAAGELVPAMEVFDAVQRGMVQMGHSGAYYWKGKEPAASFFTTVPFGLTAQEMNAWLHYGGGLELWRETYARHNLYPLAAGNSGVQMAGWFNREINSLADLKGLNMRIPGLAGEIFTRAGGSAVSIPGGELFTALQTGAIDALEWVAPYNDLALGFHKVAKYYYYPGWHEPGSTLELIVNLQAWQGLPADLQQIVTLAARAVNEDMLDEYTAMNQRALRELVEQHGVQVRRLPDDVLRELHRIAEQTYREEAAKSEQFARVYASYSDFRDTVRRWHDISEHAYLEARDL